MTPRIPRWILSKRLPVDRHDVLGDLEEVFARDVRTKGRSRAVLAYWSAALAIAIRLPRHLVTTRTKPPLQAPDSTERPHWFSPSDLRLALRRARKQPVMTLTSIIALGVGIGLPTAGYSVFQQVLNAKLPFATGERFVNLSARDAATGNPAHFSVGQVRDIRRSATALQYVGGIRVGPMNIVQPDGMVERVPGAFVSPGLMATLPYAPLAGRLFVEGDGAVGAEPVVLVRERLSERLFSRRAGALGAMLNVGGTAHTVVGILPDAAVFPNDGDLWLPVDETSLGAFDERSPVRVDVVGILAPGASIGQALAQCNQLTGQRAALGGADSLRVYVRPFTELPIGPQGETMMVMTVIVLTAVLLVIAANVTNLVSVSTSRRTAELAVRTALGASRRRLVVQLLAEVLVVGAMGAALGLTLAAFVLRMYDTILDELPPWINFALSTQSVLVALAMTVLACVVMGLPPALRATRGDAGAMLKQTGRGAGLGVGRVGGAMIAIEVALSVAMLGTAVQFARAFQEFANPLPGIAEHRVVTAQIYVDPAGSGRGDLALAPRAASDSIRALASAVRRGLMQHPWVEAVTLASDLPRILPRADDIVATRAGNSGLAHVASVGSDFFAVLGVAPRTGRVITDADQQPGAPPVAVINEAFAYANFGTREVIGERIQLAAEARGEEPPPWRDIVGVVPNLVDASALERGLGVYVPLDDAPLLSVAVRVRTLAVNHVNDLRNALFRVDPALNVSRVLPLQDASAEDKRATQVMGSALAGISVITMLLALAGIYSIVSLAVAQRTKEIGVRVALGADRRQVTGLILRRSGILVASGAAAGAVLGALFGRVKMFVFSIPEASPLLQPTLVLMVIITSICACFVPTRRALRIQPVEALRHED